ncbi:MAG TPA: LuxR C-terminal-related transcriptional regulator [Allosphingosinicella sp.]|nr:LuxR C-terminal-related transcriptional regulator [Allosphingosinicella sp.]
MADAEISRDDAYERDLFASIAATPLAMIITNPRLADNPIVAANRAFSALTGYPAAEAVGRNCRFLAGSATDRACSSILRDAIAAGRPALTELINYRKDGTPFRNAVMIAPVFGPDGAAAYFIGSQVEVPGEAALGGGVRRERALGLIAKLTPRQGQVLKEMTLGYRNKQIAARLGIDEKTVKMHRAAMLDRLGAPTSADAIRIAVEAGL